MLMIEHLRVRIASGDFDFSRHAFKRAIERNISEIEIRQAGQLAQMVEDYPDDKYSPSSLLLGFTATGRPLHMQVSRADTYLVRIITVYEPDPAAWEQNYKVRRK